MKALLKNYREAGIAQGFKRKKFVKDDPAGNCWWNFRERGFDTAIKNANS
jgi:hypothetical protein